MDIKEGPVSVPELFDETPSPSPTPPREVETVSPPFPYSDEVKVFGFEEDRGGEVSFSSSSLDERSLMMDGGSEISDDVSPPSSAFRYSTSSGTTDGFLL